MRFSRQEYWSGLPCPPPGDLPNQEIELGSPALQADSSPSEPPGKPNTLAAPQFSGVLTQWKLGEEDKRSCWIISYNCFRSNKLPRWLCSKEPACQCRRCRFNPWVRKIPRRREWQPTPVFLPGEFHGQRSLVGYSSLGRKESETTERLTHTHTYTHIQSINIGFPWGLRW